MGERWYGYQTFSGNAHQRRKALRRFKRKNSSVVLRPIAGFGVGTYKVFVVIN
jgi:hypothetical protein